MIESVLLKNFQRHEKLRVDFDPHLTVLTGPTDAGKSSVLRAVKWVCANRPGGNSFARLESGGAVSVRLKVDGATLRRSRDGGRNLYELGGEEYRAFGAGVPEPVAALLNVSELNFQGQHDAAFFFSLPPGEVAKRLNAVVDLELIDVTLANVASEVRRARSAEDLTSSRLEDCTRKRDELTWVKDADADLKVLEGIRADIAAKSARIEAVELIVTEARDLARDSREASEMMRDALAALKKVEAAVALRERLKRVGGSVDEIRRLRVERCRLEKEKVEAETTLSEALEEECPLCGRPPMR